MVHIELPDELREELLCWLRDQQEANERTAELFEAERQVSDWFSGQIAEEAREQAKRYERLRLAIAGQ